MISKSSSEIKAEAKRLGFFSCGIARAEAVDQETTLYYERWLHEGHQAGMD
jgi:epoxyqueuosine reductase